MLKDDTNERYSWARAKDYTSTRRLLTLKEAANFLGRTEWAMRDLVYSGGISYVKFPGERKYYFDVSDLNDLIESNKGNFKKGA